MVARGIIAHVRTTFLLLFLPIVLTALTGCSSSHTLQVDASQPVYFGTAPLSLLPLDSTHTQFLETVLLTTSHVAEEEHTVQGKSGAIEKGASEGVYGDIAAQLGEVLGTDTDRFIGNAELQTHIAVYIPIETYMMGFLGAIIFKNVTTEGSGEASSETIGLSGNVYTVRRTGR
jgi:hypothetical protein